MTTTIESETVQFKSDNVTISAFVAEPANANGLPAVMILHEWWGLNEHIKDIAGRFAAEGFVGFVPDLYARLGGKVTKDANEAANLMNSLSSQLVLRDLNAATKFLGQRPSVDPIKLGVIGFCMGGTLALNQAGHNSDLKAAAIFYGKVPPIETMDYLLCPILYHYGAKDGWVTREEVDRLRNGLRQFGKPGEVVTYPNGQHAFFNDTRPDVYSKPDAEQAWRKTIGFFRRHLGG